MRATKLLIDLNAIDFNIKSIKKMLSSSTQIMPVIKAAGYGTGDVDLKDVLDKNDISIVAVALSQEGIHLRKNNFSMPIVILNQPLNEDIPEIVDYKLTPGVAVFEFVEELDKYSKQKNVITNIHLEVDTGMGRVGLKPNEVLDFVNKVQTLKNINIEGIYTHFSSSDSSKSYTDEQISKFDEVLKTLENNNISIKYKHACNTAGIINFKNAHYNLVRPGIAIYGYYPDESLKNKIELKPSAKLVSKVSFIKTVDEGTYISYNRTYKTEANARIATIPIGYADGIRRSLSNKGKVLIKGKIAPIVGNVCMDSFMVDVTNIPDVKIGDEVVLFDNKNVKLEDIANMSDTINYEILSQISTRVPRQYVKNRR